MAFKITKAEMEVLSNKATELREQKDAVELVITEFNEGLEQAWNDVEEAVNNYNSTLAEAHGLVEDLYSIHDGEWEDKTDNWKEGDKGQAIREWIDTLETAQGSLAEEISVDKPEEINLEIEDHAEVLEGIEDDPGV